MIQRLMVTKKTVNGVKDVLKVNAHQVVGHKEIISNIIDGNNIETDKTDIIAHEELATALRTTVL